MLLIITFVSLQKLNFTRLHIGFILAMMVTSAQAQQASLDGTKLVYKKFVTRSLDATARGLGFTYRTAKFVRGKDRIFEFQLSTIHDPKEGTQVKPLLGGRGLKNYYYGKINNAFALRFGYGNQKAMFNREVPNAYEIKQGYTIGINAALLKPVYVQVAGSDVTSSNIKAYNPSDTSELVIGRVAFYNGLMKSKFNPSLFLKYYWTFDFSKDDEVIKSVEVGVIGDVYLNRLNIMARDNNRRFFATLYASYVFGSKKY